MRKNESDFQPAVGGSSLLVMVSVLCLTVFALLSLSSVQAQRRMADAAVQSVTDYYAADLQAEQIFARLRNGEAVDGVLENGGTCEFEVPISDRQTLLVTLERDDNRWDVRRWQAVTAEAEPEDSLNVWQGTNGEEETP